jgi:hypothetical protein
VFSIKLKDLPAFGRVFCVGVLIISKIGVSINTYFQKREGKFFDRDYLSTDRENEKAYVFSGSRACSQPLDKLNPQKPQVVSVFTLRAIQTIMK